MPDLTIPLVIATVFTAGGYAITRAGRHAEAIGDWLFTVLVLTAIGTATAFAGQTIQRHHPVDQAAREAMLRGQRGAPPGRTWTRLDVP